MITGIDHIAFGVVDIEKAIDFYTQSMGFRLGRRGTHNLSGRAIVFVHDPVTRVKFELIETDAENAGFSHLAFNTSDVSEEVTAINERYEILPERGPKRTEAAKMMTAHYNDLNGLPIQLCCYDKGAAETQLPEI